jgi:hypothetical protein
MLATRIHGYKQPLVLEDIEVPDIKPDEVLVRGSKTVTRISSCRAPAILSDALSLCSTFNRRARRDGRPT